LKKLADGSEGELFAQIAKDREAEVYALYDEAVKQEKDWAEYLFKDGSVIGLNAKILGDFVEYMANKRMKTIGLKAMYAQTTNPLPWIDSWISSKDTQVAPQEEEITNYLIGGIKNDVSSNTFSGMDL
jgi:ribonucleoside-diphosphate reductase beta chain